jgi:CheY-like chemotaxis protein
MAMMTPVEILLVEDTPTDAELTLRALKRSNLTNRVTWVKDGAEALDYLFFTGDYASRERAHPRLVLLDLKLPKVDGIAVARRIKSDPSTQHIPVVVLTSSAQDRDIVETYELGVNSYLVKPVNSGDFLDVVAQAGLYWSVLNKMPGDQ